MTHEQNKQNVVDAVKTILNSLNGGNQQEIANAIVMTVCGDHRTLQQAFWSVMLQAQILYAGNMTDLRNEQAVEFAKEVKKLAEEKNVNFGILVLCMSRG